MVNNYWNNVVGTLETLGYRNTVIIIHTVTMARLVDKGYCTPVTYPRIPAANSDYTEWKFGVRGAITTIVFDAIAFFFNAFTRVRANRWPRLFRLNMMMTTKRQLFIPGSITIIGNWIDFASCFSQTDRPSLENYFSSKNWKRRDKEMIEEMFPDQTVVTSMLYE